MLEIARRTMAFSVFLVVSLTAFSCGSDNERVEPGTKVRIGYLPMVSSLPYFVAVEKEYFLDEGLAVDAIPIATSNNVAQSLLANAIDVAIELSVVPLLVQDTSGSHYKIFSTSIITEDNGFDAILVRPNSPARTFCDIAGLKVATFPGSTSRNTVLGLFAKKCVGRPAPNTIEVPPASHIQNLVSGAVDAIHAYEPTLSAGIAGQKLRKISGSLYGMELNPSPIGVAALNSTWAKANPKVAKAAVRAIDKAVNYIRFNEDDARRILAKYTGTTIELANDMRIMPMSSSDSVNAVQLGKYLELLRSRGEIRGAAATDQLIYKK